MNADQLADLIFSVKKNDAFVVDKIMRHSPTLVFFLRKLLTVD